MIRVYLVAALALSLLANAFLGWQWAQAGAQCKADQAEATVDANNAVRKHETKRDQALDNVTVQTARDTRKAVDQTKETARERTQAIRRVVVRGDCVRPGGLPSLDAAVDQARTAAGH